MADVVTELAAGPIYTSCFMQKPGAWFTVSIHRHTRIAMVESTSLRSIRASERISWNYLTHLLRGVPKDLQRLIHAMAITTNVLSTQGKYRRCPCPCSPLEQSSKEDSRCAIAGKPPICRPFSSVPSYLVNRLVFTGFRKIL